MRDSAFNHPLVDLRLGALPCCLGCLPIDGLRSSLDGGPGRDTESGRVPSRRNLRHPQLPCSRSYSHAPLSQRARQPESLGRRPRGQSGVLLSSDGTKSLLVESALFTPKRRNLSCESVSRGTENCRERGQLRCTSRLESSTSSSRCFSFSVC